MKYYSTDLNKFFDSEQELIKAENEAKEKERITKAKAEQARAEKERAEAAKRAERTRRAKEVEEAFREAREAQNKVSKLLTDFTKDYGYFHTTFSCDDVGENDVFDFLSVLSKFLN